MPAEMAQARPHRKDRPKKPANPLIKGILAFCKKASISVVDAPNEVEQSADAGDVRYHDATATAKAKTTDGLVGLKISPSDLPKRHTIYPPLLLLPHKFPTHSARWTDVYCALSEDDKEELFRCIAEEGFVGKQISRIAINAPIAAEEEEGDEDGLDVMVAAADAAVSEASASSLRKGKENILRSPSGLVPVYGDWGPPGRGAGGGGGRKRSPGVVDPTRPDFEEAFWTSTSQHKGITQCWAPLYTMFSRGNISEKARILGLCPQGRFNTASQFPGLTVNELCEPVESIDVVDFYVGIGYFAFCYLAKGVRRVWGWDINPWSIEGLRRGCERNGWGSLVVKVDDQGNLVGQDVADVVRGIQEGDKGLTRLPPGGQEEGRQREVKCIAFLGDNKWADKVMREFQEAGMEFNVRHANLGLLPTSRGSWDNAAKAIVGLRGSGGKGKDGWMHVHENVDVRDIDNMARQIVRDIHRLVQVEFPSREGWSVSSDHVQQVKTYAPGVMHCVYDIQIRPNG